MFLIGIDLGNDFSQVCYYNFIDGQPESVNFSHEGATICAPTAVLKENKPEGGWLAGDLAVSCNEIGEGAFFDKLLTRAESKEPVSSGDVMVMPVELVKEYLAFLIQAATIAFGGDEEIDKICVTIRDFNISVLEIIDRAFSLLGIPAEKVLFSSYAESFVYYAISQQESLYRNDNVLFDYSSDGLRYFRMASVYERGTRIFLTECIDMTKEVGPVNDREKLEELLLMVAKEQFDRKAISTVYLTGDGFEGDFSAERFINFICMKRRVFAGQNLYAKGACYQAYDICVGEKYKDCIIGCKERVTTGIEMKISDRQTDKILRLVKPGVNWYKAGCNYDFIVDNANEIEIFLSPVNSREKQLLKFPLSEFPKREDKAYRIGVEIGFYSDDRCYIKITDKGFGEFVKSSGKVIYEDILL